MIILNKLSIDLNILKLFFLEIQMIYGIGSKNKIYKKLGLLNTTRFFFIFFIKKFIGFENFIIRRSSVSYDLKKKVSDFIKKKKLKKLMKVLDIDYVYLLEVNVLIQTIKPNVF